MVGTPYKEVHRSPSTAASVASGLKDSAEEEFSSAAPAGGLRTWRALLAAETAEQNNASWASGGATHQLLFQIGKTPTPALPKPNQAKNPPQPNPQSK